ncbi:unnamed protein product [Caenorhabditis brenneri]
MAATIWLNGLKVKSLTVGQSVYTYTDVDIQENAKEILGYLNELFSCPLPTIFIYSEYVRKSRKPFFFGLKECNALYVRGDRKMKNIELRPILKELTIKQRLSLDLPIKKSFKFDIEECKQPEQIFIILWAHWVTSEMMFKLNCSHLMLNRCQLTTGDCQKFVERWLNSYDTFISFVQFDWENGTPEDLNFETLGVELMEFDPETRDPAYCISQITAMDVSSGLDFFRKDGLMATVAVFSNVFLFCVWHKRHQNMDGVERFFNIGNCKQPEEIFIAYYAHWVTSEMMFKLKCSHLMLNGCQLTTGDCQKFVERWLNSDDTFISFVQFDWEKGAPEDLNFENLGVELKEFDPETRDPAYRYSNYTALDVSSGRDFFRKDGLMATVAVFTNVFIFCVWHKRHQNMDGVGRYVSLI